MVLDSSDDGEVVVCGDGATVDTDVPTVNVKCEPTALDDVLTMPKAVDKLNHREGVVIHARHAEPHKDGKAAVLVERGLEGHLRWLTTVHYESRQSQLSCPGTIVCVVSTFPFPPYLMSPAVVKMDAMKSRLRG